MSNTRLLSMCLLQLAFLFILVAAGLMLSTQPAQADCVPGNQVDKPAFFADVARQLRNPSVPEEAIPFAVQAFLAWEPYENTAACWNPLATTLRYTDDACRSWNLPGNRAGVQQYPSRECGIRATADTLNYTFNGNGRAYQAIRHMMARQGFDEAVLLEELRRWVGSEGYARAVVSRWRELYYGSESGPPSGYTFCAWEDERCRFGGTADVAYGANGTFAYRTGVRNGIDCNNGVFGDPLPGVRKACYIRPVHSGQPDYTPPSGYTFCAWEDERCRFSGTADVAYGANGTFAYRTGVRNGIDCNNGVFGDPRPGVRKACYIRQTAAGPTQCPGQYRAEYFANRNLSGNPVLVRCEGWPIAHDWGGGSPDSGVPEDGFSARWTGRARIEAGTYTFIARADDGVRVWLDGDVIIDAWWDQPPTEYRVTRNVSAGEHEVQVEYYENGGDAVAEFRWEQAGASASCQGQPLALEQRVEGRLSNATPAVVYCLRGTAGRIISARMFALGNDSLDPYLLILTPDGELLDDNDDGLNIGYNSFLSVRLPEDGVYPIVATRYGDTEGRYALRVDGGFEAAVGDLDRDCDVDNVDRDRLRAALGTADPDADLDLDGMVSTRDAIFQMRSLGIRCQ
jgi:hypothetical protein